jgi:hypothetical protein
MSRHIGQGSLVVLVLVAGVAVACGGPEAHEGSAAVVAVGVGQQAKVLAYPSGRAHPHGPEADEQSRARPHLYARPVWSGGGRHPMWRGCQHVYNPTLTSFIYSSPSKHSG